MPGGRGDRPGRERFGRARAGATSGTAGCAAGVHGSRAVASARGEQHGGTRKSEREERPARGEARGPAAARASSRATAAPSSVARTHSYEQRGLHFGRSRRSTRNYNPRRPGPPPLARLCSLSRLRSLLLDARARVAEAVEGEGVHRSICAGGRGLWSVGSEEEERKRSRVERGSSAARPRRRRCESGTHHFVLAPGRAERVVGTFALVRGVGLEERMQKLAELRTRERELATARRRRRRREERNTETH